MLRRAGFIVLCVALISACSRGSSQPLTATGRGTTRALDGSIAVPDVACRTLDKAKASIKDVGLKAKAHDATGDGRMQIVDSNWVVLSQTPAAGVAATAGETVGLEVAKEGERPCPAHVIVVDHRCVADVGTVFDNDPSTDDATTNDDLAADHPSSDDNPGTAINDAAADGRQRVLRELCPGQSGRGRTALPGTTRLPT